MLKFSELKQVPLREIWQHEASDFTTVAGGKYSESWETRSEWILSS